MANIGTFKKTGNDYRDEIVTVLLQKKNVTIVAEEPSDNESAQIEPTNWSDCGI